MKKPMLVANWKMYIDKPDAAKRFIAGLKRRSKILTAAEVVIAPPFVLLPDLASLLARSKTVRLAAQTLSAHRDPAHTGEVSAAMLKSFGVSQVIVGHSERRAQGETNEMVRQQLERAREAGLAVVLCVGERERDQSGSYYSFIEEQLASALRGGAPAKVCIAYEPVWAIGKTAADAMQPSQLEEMAIFIRKTLVELMGRATALKIPILYGGSVEGSNARALLEVGVAGFLIGHAGADLDSFIEILQACQK